MNQPQRRKFTNEEKLAEVEREIKQREFVYPRRIAANKMTKASADEQLDLMRQIAEDYREKAKGERLL